MSNSCGECGAEVPEEAEYCPSCGAEVGSGGVPLKRSVIAGAVVAVLLIGAVFGGGMLQDTSNAEDAPGFTARDVRSGENFSLSEYRGKWVVLDFSTAWCTVCQQMEPVLEKYYVESKPGDVVFLTVSNEKDAEAYRKFAEEKEYAEEADWPHLIDQTSGVYMDYGVQVLPTFVLVGPDGKIRGRKKGKMSYKEFQKFVEDAKS